MSEQFVSILHMLLESDILSGSIFNKATRMQHGVANEVYCLEFNKMKLVLKIYKDTFDPKGADFLSEVYKHNGINVPKILKSDIYLGRKYVLMEFIEGQHIYEIDNSNIAQIVNLVAKIPMRNLSGVCKKTIYDKTDLYYATLKKLQMTKLPHECIRHVISNYEVVISQMDRKDLFIVHGDISPTNLLWNDGNLTAILDFDETILAPKEYDLIIAVIKFCKEGSSFNIDLAKKMIGQYIEMSKDSSVDKLCTVWKFYITKVLLEKFYLHEINSIDLYESRQLQDNWITWYKLINNKNVCEEIFHKTHSEIKNSILLKAKKISMANSNNTVAQERTNSFTQSEEVK